MGCLGCSRKFSRAVPCTLVPCLWLEIEMKKFEWDDDASEEQNFRQWAMMNADERDSVGQAPLPEEEARGLFNELKESGWLTM